MSTTTSSTHKITPSRTRATVLFTILTISLVAASLVSAGLGQLHIPASEVLGSLMHHLGLDIGPIPTHPQGEAALWNVRFPRVVLGIIVGATLGIAGAVMQGIFGNPLAEPSVVGVSAGAAVGACLVIVTGWSIFGSYTIAFFAFLTGLATTIFVYLFSRSNGRTEVVTLILMGVAVNALAGAAIAFLTFMGDSQAREQIVFWQLGSLNAARWEAVAIVGPLAIIGIIGVLLLVRQLDLLSLGDRAARHLGLNVERLRIIAIVLVAVLVSAGVAFAGVIAFVGLVVPHAIRMIVGPSHRVLVPASALGGALVIVLADLVARTAMSYADLPIGMLTALIGGPFFFWLLRRTRSRSGGWA